MFMPFKNRSKNTPKNHKSAETSDPPIPILPLFQEGFTGQKTLKMTPKTYRLTAHPVTDGESGERSDKMPRMSKKRKLEWSFFLNHRNRITYNDLCRGCTRECKQSFRAVVLLCPRYYSKRWKKEDSAYGR